MWITFQRIFHGRIIYSIFHNRHKCPVRFCNHNIITLYSEEDVTSRTTAPLTCKFPRDYFFWVIANILDFIKYHLPISRIFSTSTEVFDVLS